MNSESAVLVLLLIKIQRYENAAQRPKALSSHIFVKDNQTGLMAAT